MTSFAVFPVCGGEVNEYVSSFLKFNQSLAFAVAADSCFLLLAIAWALMIRHPPILRALISTMQAVHGNGSCMVLSICQLSELFTDTFFAIAATTLVTGKMELPHRGRLLCRG